jgi:hypothetical protein
MPSGEADWPLQPIAGDAAMLPYAALSEGAYAWGVLVAVVPVHPSAIRATLPTLRHSRISLASAPYC